MFTAVKKQWLIDRVEANRHKHIAIYENAMEGYRKAALAALKDAADTIKRGKTLDSYLYFQQPSNHVKEYDRVLEMLGSSVEDEIDLNEGDFAKYIRDEWDWTDTFVGSTSQYTATETVH